MTKPDVFTSDNARVLAPTASQAVLLIAQAEALWTETLKPTFGRSASVRRRHYFGADAEWQAGYWSEYGFHIRGRGETAEAAVRDAIENRLPDDPKGGAL